jgi:hypothetical protein
MSDYVFTESERQILRSEGFITGLEKIAAGKPHLREEFDNFRSGWLGVWMEGNFAEAEKEVARIDAVLKRLKHVSGSLERSKRVPANDPRVAQFKNDVRALDGWMVSLLETVFRIIAFMDKKRARVKLSELNVSMTNLMNERDAVNDPFRKNSTHFDSYMKL